MSVARRKSRDANEPTPSRDIASNAGVHPVTRWSLVFAARGEPGDGAARKALTELTALYRDPVVSYVRGQGYPEEGANGVVQQFFETLPARLPSRTTEEGGGRFRVWLLKALRTFLSEQQMPCMTSPAPEETSETVVASARAGRRAPNDDSPPSAPPRWVGDYQLIELLGEGGMSTVYRARQRDSDRDVALKSVKPELMAYPDVVTRFRKAVEIAGRLEHQSIARVYDRSHLYDDFPFYTMQLVGGGTLADPRGRERFREPRRAARLMIQIARAVQFAHEHERGRVSTENRAKTHLAGRGPAAGSRGEGVPNPRENSNNQLEQTGG